MRKHVPSKSSNHLGQVHKLGGAERKALLAEALQDQPDARVASKYCKVALAHSILYTCLVHHTEATAEGREVKQAKRKAVECPVEGCDIVTGRLAEHLTNKHGMDKRYANTKRHALRLARTDDDDIAEEEVEFLEKLPSKMEPLEGDSISIN